MANSFTTENSNRTRVFSLYTNSDPAFSRFLAAQQLAFDLMHLKAAVLCNNDPQLKWKEQKKTFHLIKKHAEWRLVEGSFPLSDEWNCTRQLIFMISASLVEWLGWKFSKNKLRLENSSLKVFLIVCHNHDPPHSSTTNLNQFSRHKLRRQSTNAPSIVEYLIPNQWIIPEKAFKQLIKIPRNATNRARTFWDILIVMCRPFEWIYVKIIIFMSVG